MADFMELGDAKALIETACGTEVYGTKVHGELWALFNVPIVPSTDPRDYLTVSIDRIDVPSDFGVDEPGFESDEDAMDHVRHRAAAGSKLHLRALAIHHAADSMRFHMWGEAMIDSRIGPEYAA